MMNSKYSMCGALLMAAAIFMAGCGSSKSIVTARQDADFLYYQKDYHSAFDKYSQIIESYVSKKETVPPELYASAGKCLYYADSQAAAIPYFKLAEDAGYEDEQILMLQIKYYADADNLSKELDRLEKYSALYPEGIDIAFVNYRMYLRYCEMQEYGKAHLRYHSLSDEYRDDVAVLEKQHLVCTKLNRKDEADSIARQLYNMNPNNLIGLNYMAYDAYITTENEYVAAIKAYEANKTTSGYRVMLMTTEPLVARYKKAKDLYIRLYNQYKRPHDAAILSRICTRLNDKQNAAYYDKLSKNNQK
jgi:tetratricopeptide (TPR) repeat protein